VGYRLGTEASRLGRTGGWQTDKRAWGTGSGVFTGTLLPVGLGGTFQVN